MADPIAAGALRAKPRERSRAGCFPFLISSCPASFFPSTAADLGSAALTFRQDLALSAEVFGLGAGIFFLGYFLFEVPSNLLLEKVGARIWIARIMITWGLISAAMALVKGETSFYFVRFLLGLAEAGFFPGIILYLTYWYTAAERAKVVGMFMVAVPLSSAIGAPLSSWILGAFAGVGGLASWQWLFIIEALPAVVLDFVVLGYLGDGPAAVEMAGDGSKGIASSPISPPTRAAPRGRARVHVRRSAPPSRACRASRSSLSASSPASTASAAERRGSWKRSASIAQTGWVVTIPFVAALVMVPWTKHSDATRERTRHVALPAFLGGVGLIVGSYLSSPLLAMIALTLGSVGTFAALPTFWTLPTALLTGTAAAGGIALINAIGNVGGFVGPYLVGWIKDNALAMKIVADQAGANALSIAVIGGFMIAAGLLTLALGHDPALEEGAHE